MPVDAMITSRERRRRFVPKAPAPILSLILALFAGCGSNGGSPEAASFAASGDVAEQAGLSAFLALSPCAGLEAPEPGSCVFQTTGHYTSKEPYHPRQIPGSYALPPAGFTVQAVQHVARHGSRALSSADDDDLMLQLWIQARSEGALTPLGEALGPVLEDIVRVHNEVGYGLISGLGELEQETTAARLVERHPELFRTMVERGDRIHWFHSGRDRADQSGEAFVRGLVAAMPELEGLIESGEASPETLYFNEAEGSEAYQRYSDADPRMLAALESIEEDPRTREMARLMLRQLFSEPFVDRLAIGAYRFEAQADADDVLADELDAAEALYGLYSIGVGMTEEADWALGRFVHPEAVAWFAYVDDAGSFYERGPGFSDEDISYRGAAALVRDMVERAEGWLAGETAHAVTVRFSHAQALMPLAAFLGIQGASEEVDPGELYRYETNPWRSALASPMSANVQWDVYRNESGVTLVRMLHQEGEARFAPNCEPWGGTEVFYELAEIRRCTGI